jgi:hypothetical protein
VTVCALPESVAEQPRISARIGVGILIGICLVSALIGRLSYLVCPFDSDGAMFVYMGKLVSHGGRIGYELIDNKFPTVGLIISPCWRMFGYCWPGYVLLQMGLSLLAALLLARSARRNIGAYAGLPTGLFALVYLNFGFAVFGGFQLETLQAFFSVLAATAAMEAIAGDEAKDAFLVGLAAGVAAMLKPSGLAVLAAFGIAIFFKHRRWLSHFAAATAGFAIPAAATFTYLRAANLLGVVPEIWRQISGYASNSPWEPWDLSKPVVVIVILGFPMLIRSVVFRRREHRVSTRTDWSIALFAIFWILLEAGGIAAQRRMYAYHFLVLAAPASVLFGLIPRKSSSLPLAATLVIPALLSAFAGILVLANAPNSLARSAPEDYLADHAQPGDAVWLDGMMRLLVRTDLQPGSRYPMTFLWVNDDDAPLRYCDAMLADFDRTRPKFIVLPTQFDRYVHAVSDHIKELGLRPNRKANFIAAWMRLREYVQRNYHAEARAGADTIYRRGF